MCGDKKEIYKLLGTGTTVDKFSRADEMKWTDSPGGRVQNDYAGYALDDLWGFINHFRTVMGGIDPDTHQPRWTWIGVTSGDRPAFGWKLLDGALNKGECATLAYALEGLISFPSPYGAGNDLFMPLHNQKRVASYTGDFNKGFISAHPKGGVFGLKPNLYGPNGKSKEYYIWSNHKTVEYRAKLYDPSYGKVYNKPSDMAVCQIAKRLNLCPTNLPLDPQKNFTPLSDVYVEQVVITNDTSNNNVLGFYTVCFKYPQAGKLLTPTAFFLVTRAAGGLKSALEKQIIATAYIGPFIYGNGNSANNFGFPTDTDKLSTLNSVLKDIQF